jgi:hypothetical protein
MRRIKMNLRNTTCGTALLLLFFSAGRAHAEGGINNMAAPAVTPDNYGCVVYACNGEGFPILPLLPPGQAAHNPGPTIPDIGGPFGLGSSFFRGTTINTLIRTNVNTIPPADGPL